MPGCGEVQEFTVLLLHLEDQGLVPSTYVRQLQPLGELTMLTNMTNRVWQE